MKFVVSIIGVCLMLLPCNVIAQQTKTNKYNTGIGFRFGEEDGISFKQFINNNKAIEGILKISENQFNVTILIETHEQAFNTEGLLWFYGGGGHLNIQSNRHKPYLQYNDHILNEAEKFLGLGIDGILGIEYKIKPIPFLVSLDFKPYLEVTLNGNIWVSMDPAIGLKIVF